MTLSFSRLVNSKADLQRRNLVADSFPFNLHHFIMDQDLRDALEAPHEPADDKPNQSKKKEESGGDDPRGDMCVHSSFICLFPPFLSSL